jgi:hypothetical protein
MKHRANSKCSGSSSWSSTVPSEASCYVSVVPDCLGSSLSLHISGVDTASERLAGGSTGKSYLEVATERLHEVG